MGVRKSGNGGADEYFEGVRGSIYRHLASTQIDGRCTLIAPWDRNEKEELILGRPPVKVTFWFGEYQDSEMPLYFETVLDSRFRYTDYTWALTQAMGETHVGRPVGQEKVRSEND